MRTNVFVKTGLVLSMVLALGACRSFSWQGRNANLTEQEAALGLKDVATLQAEFNKERRWSTLSRTIDGRTNALARDLDNIWSTIDRHLFNYSRTDPYVNHETDQNYFSAVLSNGVGTGIYTNVVPWMPVD